MSRNSWAEDYGYTKDDPEAPWHKPQRSRARKDTRKWCRGKKDVAHLLETIKDPSSPDRPCRWATSRETWICYHVRACTRCGKKVEFFWFNRADQCPDYPGATS